MTAIGAMGEHEVIRRLVSMLGDDAGLLVGAGDDCAVCCMPGVGMDQVFTTDPVVEGVHFLHGEIPERIGNKAVGRVLSDIAAMGARPQWLLVNVVAAPGTEMEYLEGIYVGMSALCSRFGATIIGGDLSKGAQLELHLFGTGLLPSGSALLRSGAKAGDSVCVTGVLGGSSAGKHLDFIPRVEEGIFLRETGLVNAMMDVSDGLATDLRHILAQSKVGADLDAEAIPVVDGLNAALYDGEDFELLLTTSDPGSLQAQWKDRFGSGLPLIGKITEEGGVLRLDGEVVESKAYEHFSNHNQGERNE